MKKKRQRRKKTNWNLILTIIGISAFLAIIGVAIYGGTHGWFQSTVNLQQKNVTLTQNMITPSTNTPAYSTCSQLCSVNGFSQYYDGITCKVGESKITYGYPNQAPLLSCCCYNEQSTPSCIDSDGDDRDAVGHVTYGSETFYDQCLQVGQGVTEYICVNNQPTTKNWACDLGEICMQTRSGGHCIPAPHIWNPGDVVFMGGGSGQITGGTIPVGASLDLSDYGFETGGTCRLGVKITESWTYATGTPTCTGINGMEGLRWDLYDSSGLEWSQVDTIPHPPITYDLHPENHILQWDGVTDWRGTVSKTLNLPACNIAYDYQIVIYIYDC